MNKLIFVSYGTHTTNYVASVDAEVTKSLPIYNTHPKSYYILVKKRNLRQKEGKIATKNFFRLFIFSFFCFPNLK